MGSTPHVRPTGRRAKYGDMEMSITFPDPLRIAEGTYLIRPLGQAPGAPVAMHVNPAA